MAINHFLAREEAAQRKPSELNQVLKRAERSIVVGKTILGKWRACPRRTGSGMNGGCLGKRL
jgi:hypothetical protein